VHCWFSRHDMVTKFFLGMMLGAAFILTGDIFVPCLMHLVYNVLAFKIFRSEKNKV